MRAFFRSRQGAQNSLSPRDQPARYRSIGSGIS